MQFYASEASFLDSSILLKFEFSRLFKGLFTF